MEIFFVILLLVFGIGSFLFSLFGADRAIRNFAAFAVGIYVFTICFHINNYVQQNEPASVQTCFTEFTAPLKYVGGLYGKYTPRKSTYLPAECNVIKDHRIIYETSEGDYVCTATNVFEAVESCVVGDTYFDGVTKTFRQCAEHFGRRTELINSNN